jgi:hypothetical protein
LLHLGRHGLQALALVLNLGKSVNLHGDHFPTKTAGWGNGPHLRRSLRDQQELRILESAEKAIEQHPDRRG